MPRPQTAAIPKQHLCPVCRARWKQQGGLCRACAVAAGDTSTLRDRQALHARSPRVKRVGLIPRPPIFRRYGSTTYEITFDGSRPDYQISH